MKNLEVLRTLKTGGMGEVLLARRRGPGGFEQLLAVKTIRGDLAGSQSVRDMFLDEARLLARLAHPAIATVLDFGEDAGELYLAMEYVRGIRFRELIELRPPPEIAARAIAEACRGLHAAHELTDLGGNPLGVVHRDISPENLMLGFDGQVKVLDFGIALVRGRATVTEHGMIKGKPPYMSPEQVRGDALDRRSDVFSIALVLHELLTGAPVFEGDNMYTVARAVIEAAIAPPGFGDAVVMAALERDRAMRTPTAAALAESLERAAGAGESLEAWTERVLASEREKHREWLAEALLGPGGAKPVGRPSGMVTAAAMPAPAPTPAPSLETKTQPRSRGTLVFALIVIALLAGAGVLALFASHGDTPAVAAAAPDAATVTVPVTVADAATVTVPVTVTVTDAGAVAPTVPAHRHPHPAAPADAGVRKVAPPPPHVDAAPAAAAPPGMLTITANPYADVHVDGADWGSTNIYKRHLAAGTHQVDLLDPASHETRLHKTITITSGAVSRIDL